MGRLICVLLLVLCPAFLHVAAAEERVIYSLGTGKEYACLYNDVDTSLVRFRKNQQLKVVSFRAGIRKVTRRIKANRKKIAGFRPSSGKFQIAKLSRIVDRDINLRKDIKLCRSGILISVRPHPSAACAVVGDSGSGTVARIIKGSVCDHGDSPVVHILSYGKTWCSGTIIGPRTVLTAAHCVGNLEAEYSIRTGLGDYQVINVMSHPNYWNGTFQRQENFDVGLFVVDRPFDSQIAKLHLDNDLIAGERAIIAGFGLDEHNSMGQFRAGFMSVNSSDELSVSALYDGTFSDTCNGDSGGPFLVEREGEWKLVAVTSNGNINCTPPDDARFAALSHPDIQEFIFTNLN